jgi:hypothetical protein
VVNYIFLPFICEEQKWVVSNQAGSNLALAAETSLGFFLLGINFSLLGLAPPVPFRPKLIPRWWICALLNFKFVISLYLISPRKVSCHRWRVQLFFHLGLCLICFAAQCGNKKSRHAKSFVSSLPPFSHEADLSIAAGSVDHRRGVGLLGRPLTRSHRQSHFLVLLFIGNCPSTKQTSVHALAACLVIMSHKILWDIYKYPLFHYFV